MPLVLKGEFHEQNQRFKEQFNTPEFHLQIDGWLSRNESDGRELLVANCWFLGEEKSSRMWAEYGGSKESIAIKSTIGRLSKCVAVPSDPNMSQLGLVRYVDHENHRMTSYEANQVIERAFLKDGSKFAHEQEVRIVTMNFKTTWCVSPDGKPYAKDEVAGAKANNFDGGGLYIRTDLRNLIAEVVVCPCAEDWFLRLVSRIVELSGIPAAVVPSRCGNA